MNILKSLFWLSDKPQNAASGSVSGRVNEPASSKELSILELS